MESLIKVWPRLSKQLTGKRLLLLLDYDGTLTPIREKPEQAVLSVGVKKQLLRLSRNPNITLGIVSGRDFNDLKRKVGLKGLIYVSNHGLKIEGKGIKFEVSPPRAALKTLDRFRLQLARKTQGIAGVLIEKKKFSFALHYRLVRAKELKRLLSCFCQVFARYKRCGFVVKTGKKVLEVMPALDWNKGKAALHILRHIKMVCRPQNVVPIYIGDDKTDENAFHALSKAGITALVGTSKTSSARYIIDDTEGLYTFLRVISIHNATPK